MSAPIPPNNGDSQFSRREDSYHFFSRHQMPADASFHMLCHLQDALPMPRAVKADVALLARTLVGRRAVIAYRRVRTPRTAKALSYRQQENFTRERHTEDDIE